MLALVLIAWIVSSGAAGLALGFVGRTSKARYRY